MQRTCIHTLLSRQEPAGCRFTRFDLAFLAWFLTGLPGKVQEGLLHGAAISGFGRTGFLPLLLPAGLHS